MKKLLFMLSVLGLLTACVPHTNSLSCTDEGVLDLVIEISDEFYVEEDGEKAKSYGYRIDFVRTMGTDYSEREVGILECKANLFITEDGEEREVDIDYTVQPLDEGGVFVEVF